MRTLFVSGRPSLPLVLLAGFVGIATLLPFVAMPVPLLGSLALAPLVLAAGHVSALTRRDWSTRLALVDGITLALCAVAIASFALGVIIYGYSREAGIAAFGFVVSLLLVLTVPRVVQTPGELEALVTWFIVGGTGAAALGIALWALPAPLSERALLYLTPLGYPDAEVVRMVYGTALERATGTSVDANLFGGLMMLTASLVAGQLFAARRVLPRSVLAAAGILVLAALVLSFSRSAWVGMGIALLYLGVSFERRALALMAICVVLVVAVPALRERIAGAITVQDAASVLRVEEYRASRDLIAAHPLLGVGFGPAEGINLVRRVSNMYLLAAEHMGLTGLLGLLILLGTIGRRSLRWVKRSDNGAGNYAGLQAALVGMLTIGLFDHYFMNGLFPHTTGLFWLFTSLLLVAAQLRSQEAPRMRARRLPGARLDEPGVPQTARVEGSATPVSHPSARR